MGPIWARALSVLLAVALPYGAHAQAGDRPVSDRELVIATKEAPPFVMKHPDGTWYGISIDLWRRIADRLRLRYRFSEQATVEALMEGTAQGSFDAAIAALTVTSARERVVDFSQPFYSAGLGGAVPATENAWISIARALLSFGFFQAVAALLAIAMGVGFVIWLLERRRTEHFSGARRASAPACGGPPWR